MTSYDDFFQRVDEVRHLLDVVAPGWSPETTAAGGPIPHPDPGIAGTLSRASIVLLVSYFEGFLKDLCDEAFDSIRQSSIVGPEFSDHLRGYALMRHVRTLRTTEDPAALWGCVSQLLAIGGAFSNAATVAEEMLPRDDVKRAITSIEPQKINELLRALGDPDLNSSPMSRHGQRLRGLKQVRDNAVHGNEQELPSLAYADVRQNMDLLLAAASELQERVNHLVSQATAKT